MKNIKLSKAVIIKIARAATEKYAEKKEKKAKEKRTYLASLIEVPAPILAMWQDEELKDWLYITTNVYVNNVYCICGPVPANKKVPRIILNKQQQKKYDKLSEDFTKLNNEYNSIFYKVKDALSVYKYTKKVAECLPELIPYMEAILPQLEVSCNIVENLSELKSKLK